MRKMATEVLRPQHQLAERFHDRPASFHPRRVFPASTGNLATLVVTRRHQRKTSPPAKKKSAANRSGHSHRSGVPDPRTAHVTLLKRGESLSSIAGGHPIRGPVGDLKQIRLAPADIYVGSSFSMSPSPRSVPLPSFFGRKDSNDGATRDLRRLLRLEL